MAAASATPSAFAVPFAPRVCEAARALVASGVRRVCVTGGTGFVGRHLLRLLAEAGAEITCITRATSRTAHISASVRMAPANLATGEGLDEALHGQDAVIHLAALLFGLHWQDYLRGNALAARQLGLALAREAARSGSTLRRVVLVSSLAATGPSAVSPGVNDFTAPAPVSAYGWSKFMAEQTLARHLEPLGIPHLLVTLRPPIIYGSGDKGLLPYFQSARAGVVITPGFGRVFPVSAIHAHDMAQAVVCALRPEAHGVYHCNDGAEHDMASLGRLMAELQGRRARVLGMPLPVMAAAASLCGLAAPLVLRCTGRVPSWNPDKYLEAKQPGWLCDGSRLADELGYAPAMSLREGLSEAVAGYKAEGWL